MHMPSLKKEEEDPRRSKVVWSNQRFDHPSLHPICPVLQHARLSMLCNMSGERSPMSLQFVSLKDLPHTYSCTCFYSKENKDRNKQGLYRFESPRSLHFIEMPKFILFLLIYFLFYCCYNNLFFMPNYV